MAGLPADYRRSANSMVMRTGRHNVPDEWRFNLNGHAQRSSPEEDYRERVYSEDGSSARNVDYPPYQFHECIGMTDAPVSSADPGLEQIMKLILSCLIKGEHQTRLILDRLAMASLSPTTIVVLHAGEADDADQHAVGRSSAIAETMPAETPAGAAVSGSAVGGVFGWVVGYGVLSLPGAILGGAVGAVAGAAIGATRQAFAPHITEDVRHHYANRITRDRAAVLVQVENIHQYEQVLTTFLEEGGRHILTSRNNPDVAESAQLEMLLHQPEGADESPSAEAPPGQPI